MTNNLVETTRQQAELASQPVLSITPEQLASPQIADFNLTVTNLGVATLTHIGIFEDYFVALKPPEQQLALIPFGFVSLSPTTDVIQLTVGESNPFKLQFVDTYSQMKKFLDSNPKGERMMVVRLFLKFRRQLDGREFELSKVYIIAGRGDNLIANTSGRADVYPLFAEVNSALGVK